MLARARTALVALLGALAMPWTAGMPAVAGPVLLVEAPSGRVLYAEDQDDQWYPASLTKIMTAYLAFEAVKTGTLKMSDTVSVSALAHQEPPSKLGLPVGSEINVETALRVLIVKSANDVAVMLAEKIGGSVETFADAMNAKARQLGMTRTHFVNANGLPAPGQVTTARDLARLSLAVLRDFPEHRGLWGLKDVTVDKLNLKSHNELLRTLEGADGLKTGFICDAGFNVVSSATRDDRRLIAVVLGEPSAKDRNIRAMSLLEHGFGTSQWKLMFGDVATLATMPEDQHAKPVTSVRKSVTAWNCNGRKSTRRAVTPRRKGRSTPAVATRGSKAAKGKSEPDATVSQAAPEATARGAQAHAAKRSEAAPRAATSKQ